jgi:hypothetical protein
MTTEATLLGGSRQLGEHTTMAAEAWLGGGDGGRSARQRRWGLGSPVVAGPRLISDEAGTTWGVVGKGPGSNG